MLLSVLWTFLVAKITDYLVRKWSYFIYVGHVTSSGRIILMNRKCNKVVVAYFNTILCHLVIGTEENDTFHSGHSKEWGDDFKAKEEC